ncbi:MAG: topoisomerase DNA-binding C4 zinc finger domain-containing protein [Planctomycetaceae bacterium]
MSKQRKSFGYRQRASFQAVTLIYDATWWFCETFLKDRPTTASQMLQVARDCRHSLADAGRSLTQSSEVELDGTRYARRCLEELLLDYEDYLRHRRLTQWTLDSAELNSIRNVARRPKDNSAPSPSAATTDMSMLSDHQRWSLYAGWLEHSDPAVRANAAICLIHQASFLLDQRIATLDGSAPDRARGHNGEPTEVPASSNQPMANANNSTVAAQPVTPPPSSVQPFASQAPAVVPDAPTSSVTGPRCPKCGKQMALRTAKQGRKAGQNFWGCTGYPDCKETARM